MRQYPQTDEWFAWRPVRLGALRTGPWTWLKWVWRFRGAEAGDVIYQDLEWVRSLEREPVVVQMFGPYLR